MEQANKRLLEQDEPGKEDQKMAGFSIRRDALYEEIWSLSATKVAEKYDLSYARLLKACRENDIPIPPPGYYTKLRTIHNSPQAEHDTYDKSGASFASG